MFRHKKYYSLNIIFDCKMLIFFPIFKLLKKTKEKLLDNIYAIKINVSIIEDANWINSFKKV